MSETQVKESPSLQKRETEDEIRIPILAMFISLSKQLGILSMVAGLIMIFFMFQEETFIKAGILVGTGLFLLILSGLVRCLCQIEYNTRRTFELLQNEQST